MSNIEHELLESEAASTLAQLAGAQSADEENKTGPGGESRPPHGNTINRALLNAPPSSSIVTLIKKDATKSKKEQQQRNSGQFSGTGPSPSTDNHDLRAPTGEVTTTTSTNTTTSLKLQEEPKDNIHLDRTSIEEDVRNAVTMGALIKESVLRRLNRPEDMVKRNMFAIEGKSIKFPVKLMYLLDECEEFHSIISWAHDGSSFAIYNPDALEEKVLPVIFKEARFSSFLRKLTRWGFVKKCTPLGMKFSQEKFRRGDYSMCIDINCSNKPVANDFIRVAHENSRSHQSLESPYSSQSAGAVGGLISPTSSTPAEIANATTSSRMHPHIWLPDVGRRMAPSSPGGGEINRMTDAERMRQLRETQALNDAPTFLRSTLPPSLLGASSNLLFRGENIQTGRTSAARNAPSAHRRLLDEEAQRINDLGLVTSIIRRAIEEEETRVIQALHRVSRESTSFHSNYGISLPQQPDLAKLIEQQEEQQQQQLQQLQQLQLQLLGTSVVGRDAGLGNLTPQQKALLASIIQKASQDLSHQHGSDRTSLLNRGGRPNSASALGVHVPDSVDHQSMQERGRIHSQIMSTALKGLLSASQQEEHDVDAGLISHVATNSDEVNSLSYDRNLMLQYQQQQRQQHQQLLLERERFANINDGFSPTAARGNTASNQLYSRMLSNSEGRMNQQQLPLSMPPNISNQLVNGLLNTPHNQDQNQSGGSNDFSLLTEIAKRSRNEF